jgi:predicted ArsR family transcriptional regulator
MKSCYYHDVLSGYGAAELTASFCRVDDLIYENMSPALSWQRTMTIARGDAYCDFCFARAKKGG